MAPRPTQRRARGQGKPDREPFPPQGSRRGLIHPSAQTRPGRPAPGLWLPSWSLPFPLGLTAGSCPRLSWSPLITAAGSLLALPPAASPSYSCFTAVSPVCSSAPCPLASGDLSLAHCGAPFPQVHAQPHAQEGIGRPRRGPWQLHTWSPGGLRLSLFSHRMGSALPRPSQGVLNTKGPGCPQVHATLQE